MRSFGIRRTDVPVVVRPSAYALVRSAAGAWASALTPRGTVLPGGGIDPGEDAIAAAVRETQEECGLLIRPGAVVARAVQFEYSRSEGTCFEKHCAFVTGTVIGTAEKVEADHTLVWLDDASALTLEGHRWAVQQALAR